MVVGGGALPAVRVSVSPTSLAQRGLGIGDVRDLIASTTVNRPKGRVEAGEVGYEIETNDQLFKAREFGPLILSYKNGAAVRLSDVATVTDSVEDVRTSGLVNSRPSIMLIVFRQPGANIIETVDNVQELFAAVGRLAARRRAAFRGDGPHPAHPGLPGRGGMDAGHFLPAGHFRGVRLSGQPAGHPDPGRRHGGLPWSAPSRSCT